ncbi:MAG: hypothetical protein H6811_02110 [Phycisphaeraceae bacterium]|nr:hypothetical protein [Phycisphaeraceae bacterium]
MNDTSLIMIPVLASGAMLAAVAFLVWKFDQSGLGGTCPQCGYDLQGKISGGCPECGWNRSGTGSREDPS